MKSIRELTETGEPAWPTLNEAISAAKNSVNVLTTTRESGERTLLRLQVTTRSPLGAIALETGGLMVDRGWVRVLGAPGTEIREGIVSWNNLDADDEASRTLPGARLIGHDAVGGFFALNGDRWSGEVGGVFYWGQDTLEWTDLGTSYSGWLQWLFSSDLDEFYKTMRWSGWEQEVGVLTGDQGISIYPFLWAEGEPVGDRARAHVPMRELWETAQSIAAQLTNVPPGSSVDVQGGGEATH